ncbi:MAG TPA: uroporphyrinogen decarboxylase family protein, partial [Armatimonadota bacterium]|nr:uroporphyrinogen decarboxylase family protein [Armatimonadota bacterium]
AAELDAWDRAWSLLRRPPAWMPLRPVYTPAGGATIRRSGDRLLYQAAGRAVTDLTDPATSSDRDVWDRRDAAGASPEELVPLWDVEDAAIEAQRRAAAPALQRWGGRYLLHASLGAPYWGCYSRLGFAGLMETMRTDRGLLGAMIERITHNAVQQVRLIAGSGARCLFIEECLSSSDLISEDDYLRFSYPAAERVLSAAREAGLRTVYYYCGGIEGRLGHLARLPADALAFEESKKGFAVDLARVREAVGPERPLLGNLDATLVRDLEGGGIARVVRGQFEAAGPLLATSCGSPLTLDTPPEKLDALVAATEALGAGPG